MRHFQETVLRCQATTGWSGFGLFILLLLGWCSGWMDSAAFAASSTRPNILWIIADDLGPDLGCDGNGHVSTPHLDRLASEGIRFTRAFSTAPVCSSSRTALITGRYQTEVGGHHHRTHLLPQLPPDSPPITEWFRQAGYWVCNMGSPDGKAKRAKTDYNFQHGELFDGMDWAGRKEGQPFFAQLQIKEPHRDFVQDTHPTRWKEIEVPPIYPDHEITRRDWANYLASIEVLDRKVGEVLQRLDREGLRENTLVLFFGDHGRPQARGKQWLYDGGIHIPLLVRWPARLPAGGSIDGLVSMLDFSVTSLHAAGIPVPSSLTGQDLLDPDFQGRSHIIAARDRCGDAPDRIRCVRTQRYKYIRNHHPEIPWSQISSYKKLQYPVDTLMRILHRQGALTEVQARFMQPTRPAEELYDLQKDPYETRNLAADPAHQATLFSMRARLEEWNQKHPDLGALPEGDASFQEKLMKEKRAYYEKAMKRRNLDPNLPDEAYLQWWKTQLGASQP